MEFPTGSAHPLPPDEELQALVRAAQGGDDASFVALYERIAPVLYSWAELRVRRSYRAYFEPQDIAQEVWYRSWRALPGLDLDRVPFRLWIFRTAKLVLLEAVRHARAAEARPTESPTARMFALRNLPDSATAVTHRVARDETLERFVEHVQGLDPDDRRLVVHLGLEGLTYREVGERLGISRDAVGKRWERLRRKLTADGLPAGLLALVEES